MFYDFHKLEQQPSPDKSFFKAEGFSVEGRGQHPLSGAKKYRVCMYLSQNRLGGVNAL